MNALESLDEDEHCELAGFLDIQICDSKIQRGRYSLRTLKGGKNKCELVACIRLFGALP